MARFPQSQHEHLVPVQQVWNNVREATGGKNMVGLKSFRRYAKRKQGPFKDVNVKLMNNNILVPDHQATSVVQYYADLSHSHIPTTEATQLLGRKLCTTRNLKPLAKTAVKVGNRVFVSKSAVNQILSDREEIKRLTSDGHVPLKDAAHLLGLSMVHARAKLPSKVMGPDGRYYVPVSAVEELDKKKSGLKGDKFCGKAPKGWIRVQDLSSLPKYRPYKVVWGSKEAWRMRIERHLRRYKEMPDWAKKDRTGRLIVRESHINKLMDSIPSSMAADLANVSQATIAQWYRDGRITGWWPWGGKGRKGKNLYISKADFEKNLPTLRERLETGPGPWKGLIMGGKKDVPNVVIDRFLRRNQLRAIRIKDSTERKAALEEVRTDLRNGRVGRAEITLKGLGITIPSVWRDEPEVWMEQENERIEKELEEVHKTVSPTEKPAPSLNTETLQENITRLNRELHDPMIRSNERRVRQITEELKKLGQRLE